MEEDQKKVAAFKKAGAAIKMPTARHYSEMFMSSRPNTSARQ